MTLLRSRLNVLSWTGIFTIVLTVAWQDRGLPETLAPSVPASRLAAAWSLVREAEHEAKALRTDQERGALRNLATAQAKTGDILGAQQTLAAVPDLPDKQNTSFVIEEIAIAQGVAGDMPSALRTISTLPAGYSEVRILEGIARAQVSRGDMAGAL